MDAHRWVSEVHAIYRHWEAVDCSWGQANGPASSALTNAYRLVDDLRRRGQVPVSGLEIFHVPMNGCPPEFEVQQLGRVRDWLGEAVPQRQRVARLSADYSRGEVTLDGTVHRIGDVPAAIVHLLLQSTRGYSLIKLETLASDLLGGMPVDHLDRELTKLPDCVRAAIGRDNGGHFIRDEYLG